MKNSLFSKVFMWLFVGLLITFASGFYTMTNEALIKIIFDGVGYLLIFLAQIVLCVILSARINKMKSITAKICYIAYCLLTGLTFSSIFMMFELNSIMYVFLITAVLFAIFAFIGKVLKIDLTRISTFLFIGLIGIILLEILNIFILSNSLDITLCIFSIIIFLGYVAFDIQRIKKADEIGLDNDNYAIIWAFQLYLDFINIFLDLLRLFGNEKD